MHKVLNTSKLSAEIERLNLTKLQVAEKCGISRVTLDSVLKGKEIGLHKFLKIISLLNMNVGYFFDEEVVQVRKAGRDYVEKGKIEHNGIEYNSTAIPSAENLREQIEQLKSQLKDKERIIALYEKAAK